MGWGGGGIAVAWQRKKATVHYTLDGRPHCRKFLPQPHFRIVQDLWRSAIAPSDDLK